MKKDNTKILKTIGFLLFCGLLGFGLAYGLGILAKNFSSVHSLKANLTIPKWLIFFLCMFTMYMVIVIHELGHLLTGLFQGFRFDLFVAGFLGFCREEDSIKMFFNKDFNYFGGVAATSPTQQHPDNARKFANILLAGPLASLGFALLCFLLSLVSGPNLLFFLLIASVGSLAIFLATTLPSKTGPFYTDRKRYQRLVRPGKEREIELALIDVQEKMAGKNGIEKLDVDKLRLIQQDEAPFFRYIGYFYELAYAHKFDSDKIPSIKEAMSALEKDIPDNVPALFEKELEKMLAG